MSERSKEHASKACEGNTLREFESRLIRHNEVETMTFQPFCIFRQMPFAPIYSVYPNVPSHSARTLRALALNSSVHSEFPFMLMHVQEIVCGPMAYRSVVSGHRMPGTESVGPQDRGPKTCPRAGGARMPRTGTKFVPSDIGAVPVGDAERLAHALRAALPGLPVGPSDPLVGERVACRPSGRFGVSTVLASLPTDRLDSAGRARTPVVMQYVADAHIP